MIKTIFIINASNYISGAEIGLINLINNKSDNFNYILAVPKINNLENYINEEIKIVHLPLIWLYFTLNPFRLLIFAWSIIQCCIKIIRLDKRHPFDFIYSNTIKSHIYALFVKLLSGKKIVWHVKDNIKEGFLYRYLIMKSDIIIANSSFVYNQIHTSAEKKHLIYGGVYPNLWSSKCLNSDFQLHKELNIEKNTVLVAQIGQLTKWKNQIDFIRTAELVKKYKIKVHFVIIGDDQSGREKKYKHELSNLIDQKNLNSSISFIGHRDNIKELLSEIDILLHPAINEPFGRVLIEAMSMEKPVIAYDSGGPKEIVIDGETGYLVEPYNFSGLAERIVHLYENSELRIRFGKAGRKIVIKKFNEERHVREMEDVFNNI